MSTPWWAAFGPAAARVRCGDGEHTLRWARGRLEAADHPDAEGELVLAALGGEKARCVQLAEAWGARSDDLEVLTVGPRSAADALTVTGDDAPQLRQSGWTGRGMPRGVTSYGYFSSSPTAWPRNRAMARRAELLSLLALGPGLQMRLSGAVAAAWSQGRGTTEDQNAAHAAARPALTAVLAGRLAPAVADWLGMDPDRVEARLHEGSGWGELSVSGAGPGRLLAARLPAGWLARVWAPGLAVTGGHLVVEVLDAAWPAARVLAVASPGAAPVALTVLDDGGTWTVTGRREPQ